MLCVVSVVIAMVINADVGLHNMYGFDKSNQFSRIDF
jgi:hypothetical protein